MNKLIDTGGNELPPLSAYEVTEYLSFRAMRIGSAFASEGHAWVKLDGSFAQQCCHPYDTILCDDNELYPMLTA